MKQVKNRFIGFDCFQIDFNKINSMSKTTGISLSAIIRYYLRRGLESDKGVNVSELAIAIRKSDGLVMLEQLEVKK